MNTNIKDAKKEIKWFALFNGVSQGFSFVTTILIARILIPSDYGLIEMAGILVGYVVLFGDLGVGIAVVQRKENSQQELSSLFWFTIVWGGVLCIVGVMLAYPTAWIFDNHDVILLTQVSSAIFLAGGASIIPRNILERNLRFEVLGIAESGSVIISCCVMLVLVNLDYGVWALIWGQLIREYLKLVVYCYYANWRPSLFFNFDKIRPYLRFGLNVALSNSLYYLYTKSDRFFGGKYLGTRILGEYSFALQLAMIPSDKIVYFINRFSFPVLSNCQESLEEVGRIYLKLLRFVSFLIFPIYVGGALLANDLILILLGEKWSPIILPFQLLCISQTVLSASSINKFIFNAIGRPSINLYFALISLSLFPVSFYLCAKNGFLYMLIPWMTVIPIISLMHTIILIKILNIKFFTMLQCFFHGIVGSVFMGISLILYKHFLNEYFITFGSYSIIVIQIIIGVVVYASYCFYFNRDMFVFMKSFR